MSRPRISPETVSQIKLALWSGTSQRAVALETGITQSTISRIRSGSIGHEIPWPNGSTGPMPDSEKMVSSTADRYRSYPPPVQDRILDSVNKTRAERGVPVIPSISTEYELYIASDPAEPEIELARAAKAKYAEDQRISLIMDEFDRTVRENVLEANALAWDSIVQGTIDDTPRPEPLVVPGPSGPLVFDALPLEAVTRISSANPIVIAIAKGDDQDAKTALCIAAKLHERNSRFWSEPAFARLVLDIRDKIKGKNHARDEGNRDPV